MNTIKIFDTWGTAILVFSFILLFILESKFRLRERVDNKRIRVLTNLLFSIPSLVSLKFIFIPFLLFLSECNETWQFGLAYLFQLPFMIETIIVFIALDYFIYQWHYLTHKIPFLWRLHKVHHTDLDLDLLTGVRFHFVELIISASFRGLSVLLTGATPLMVIIYEIIFELAINFHHSNLKLPLRFERIINFVIVTPRMHGIHHSIIKTETDSNFSTIFSWWDRLHKTIKTNWSEQPVIGLPEYRKPLTIPKLFKLPLLK